jgi:excisionase family DNA binding protein
VRKLSPAPPRELITVSEFAEACGVSPKTIRRRIADGSVPAYRVGSTTLRLDRRDVDLLARRVRPEEVSA